MPVKPELNINEYAFEQGTGDAMHFSEPQTEQEKVLELEQKAKEHAQKEIVKANDEFVPCVDDGTKPEESKGGIARPGADAGLALALLHFREKLNLSVADVYSLTKRFTNEVLGRKFQWHSDQHAEHSHDTGALGCGHVFKASLPDNAALYQVSATDTQELIGAMKADASEDQVCTTLHREHVAAGALAILDDEYTVNAWSGVEGTPQYFIYAVQRDKKLQAQFGEFVRAQGHDLKQDEFEAMIDTQNNATFGLLAEGLPLIGVTFVKSEDGSVTPETKFIKFIPAPVQPEAA